MHSQDTQFPPVDDRISLRLSQEMAKEVQRTHSSLAEGVRAAMHYLVEEAPLDSWEGPTPRAGADIEAKQIKRTTLRVPAALLDRVEKVVDSTDRDRSRVIRDGIRAYLAAD